MKFLVYKDRKNEWRWSLKADNGLIIADSAEGYIYKTDCIYGIELVKQSGNALVEEKMAF